MSEDLKPCPLCGAPLEIHVGFHLQWWADCKRRCGFITESFKSKEEVIEACNRRAPLPRKKWKAAELHEIIEYLLVRLEEENADDCDCGTDEPGSCVICRAKAVLSGGGDERWVLSERGHKIICEDGKLRKPTPASKKTKRRSKREK